MKKCERLAEKTLREKKEDRYCEGKKETKKKGDRNNRRARQVYPWLAQRKQESIHYTVEWGKKRSLTRGKVGIALRARRLVKEEK